jgi:hypothetical protein
MIIMLSFRTLNHEFLTRTLGFYVVTRNEQTNFGTGALWVLALAVRSSLWLSLKRKKIWPSITAYNSSCHHHHHHQWLYSPCKDLGRRFRNLITTHDRTPLNEWSARRKGLYLRRTTQHRNTRTNIHASSGIRTHNPSNQAAKNYALERAATETGL